LDTAIRTVGRALRRLVEAGVQDHAGHGQHAVARKVQGPRLLPRPLGTANQILILVLDPEVRRVVRDVRHDRDERPAGTGVREGFTQSAVVMRDEGNHHVHGMLSPVLLQYLNLAMVRQPDQQVRYHDQLARASGPTAAQQDVIDLLKRDTGGFADEVDGIKQVLRAMQAQVPGPLLFVNHGLNGLCGSAVAAA
jgi:hypothetical protein